MSFTAQKYKTILIQKYDILAKILIYHPISELRVCVYLGTGRGPHFLLRVGPVLCYKMYKIFQTVVKSEGIYKT